MRLLINVWDATEQIGAIGGHQVLAARTTRVCLCAHTHRLMQLLRTQTCCGTGHLICQVSVWPPESDETRGGSWEDAIGGTSV